VELTVGHAADASAVAAAGADAVIVATGARPAPPRWVEGWDSEKVIDAFAVLSGAVVPGRQVVVGGGDTIACRTAHFLSLQGHDVTLVGGGRASLFDHDDDDFAFDIVGEIVRPVLLEWLRESVTLVAKRHVKRVTPGGAVLDLAGAFPPFTGSTRIGPVDETLLPADVVVLGTLRRPNDELYESLRGLVPELHVVGDALEPRTVAEATAEGAAAARQVATTGMVADAT
jgi:NADPH-dependent 2,4-dienoyl-CoA reductase/sulfur reductase-like enzyme